VITYVARNLEPYRGFHIFMRALERIQKEHKTCHAVIVGGDGVSYGRRPPNEKTWRAQMLREVKLDPTRTHFMGKLARDQYVKVLQVPAAHVYLTYPFVLSWSLLEAMASGATILASDTSPVREVLSHKKSGVLKSFFDLQGISDEIVNLLCQPNLHPKIIKRSIDAAGHYSFYSGLRGYESLLEGTQKTEVAPQTMKTSSIWTPHFAATGT
jgi:glycosyltransferase involved in cell wall biosynthesis